MASERIDIEVTDKVDSSIPTKLRDIAANAERGESALLKLRAAMNGLPTAKLNALTKGASSSASELKALTSAINGLDAKLAAVSGATSQAEAALKGLDAAATAAGSSVANVGNLTENAATKFNGAAAGATRYATGMRQVAQANGLAGHQMGNLVAQLNDIGVSIASGQNPLLVLIQQGSQIQYLASTVEGGFKTLLKATASLIIGQQQVQNAATRAAAANLAAATAAETAATANLAQAGAAANVVLAEQALTVAKAEDTAASVALAAANAELAAAQAAVAATANPSAAALGRVTAAKAAQTAATNAATIANAELATAQLGAATAARGLAASEAAVASGAAGTALGLGAVGTALAYILPIAAVVGGALYAINKQANDNSGLKEYASSLGLTKDEMKQLKDVTVTYGDTAKAVFQVVGNAIWDKIGPAVTKIWGYMTDFFSSVWDIAKTVINGIIGAFVGGFNAILATWRKWPAALGDLFFSGVNRAIDAINALIRYAVVGLNSFIREGNKILDKVGLSLPELTPAQIGHVSNDYAGAAADVGNTFANELSSAMNRDYLGEFADAVAAQSVTNARNRINEQADKLIADRPDKKVTGGLSGVDKEAQAAERRSHALSQVNLQLDNELARMKMLKDARAIEERMDQITEALAQKRIKLNAEEAAAIRAKVTEIERFKYVQAEMDRVYEEATGPLRTYQATLEAVSLLQEQGAISSARAAQEQVKANRAYQEATDPLFSMKEAMDQQERTIGLYGDALVQANYYEQIRQQMLKEGIVLSGQYVAGVNAEVDALMRRNQAITQQQYIQSQLGNVLNPILEQQKEIENQANVYAELERLRQNDLINEDAYQRAKAALAVKYNEYKLNAASDFFGALASVTKDGHGAVGAISKAAAIAEATIQGYLAVQKALASAPPPWNYVAAAAVAIKTGMNVAKIASTNVGSYATGGQFIVGGRSGVDKNNINMNVTKGERVTIETVKQQRANDNQQGGGTPVVNANTKVVNLFDEKEFIGAMDSTEGERVVMNIIRRNPDGIRSALNR